MATTAITLQRAHGSKDHTLVHGPSVPVAEQQAAFKAFRRLQTHPEIAEVELRIDGDYAVQHRVALPPSPQAPPTPSTGSAPVPAQQPAGLAAGGAAPAPTESPALAPEAPSSFSAADLGLVDEAEATLTDAAPAPDPEPADEPEAEEQPAASTKKKSAKKNAK